MNYFVLFGLPVRYCIDMKVLISRFQDLQRKYHPDKFFHETEAKRLVAVSHSSNINEAWQTLRNPLTRAEYLLSLKGFDLSGGKNNIFDTVFLTEQLKLYEELSEIEKSKDNFKLKEFIQHLKNTLDVYYKKIITQFNHEMWSMAADTVQKLRFLDKLRISAEQLEEKLFNF